MDDREIKSIILNLHRRLTDNDRARLHFYLEKQVPRPLADDSSFSGTLRLMQNLFDEDKINEKDFTLLIEAFEKIQCFDAVDMLKEHQRRIRLSGWNQSTTSLASVMPPTNLQNINDWTDDKIPTNNFNLSLLNRCNNLTDSVDLNISEETQTLLSPKKRTFGMFSRMKKSSFLPYMLFIFTLVSLIMVISERMMRVHHLEDDLRNKQNFILKNQEQNNRTIKKSFDLLSEKNITIEYLNETFQKLSEEKLHLLDLIMKRNENIDLLNKTLKQSDQQHTKEIKQLTSLLVTNNETIDLLNGTITKLNQAYLQAMMHQINDALTLSDTIEELNKTLMESDQRYRQKQKQLDSVVKEKNSIIDQLNNKTCEPSKQRKKPIMKYGQKFGGGDIGMTFDDSLSPWFTTSHYLSGVIFSLIHRFTLGGFLYKSLDDNQTHIDSDFSRFYRTEGNSSSKYELDSDERIEKVSVDCSNLNIYEINEISVPTRTVTGVQFYTTKNRTIPPYIKLRGENVQYEFFPGYTLGYVTGTASTEIGQLQFVWYRTKT